ncbi:hypothetical protein Ahy_B05g079386 isoform A [Arachis hypogaea]|uniref:Uncharacterized protein n=1 Tax=Arachis hypogaea TaxID=3818 RepID=A0A444Z9Q1_ARAHY|nr:hypothetical protein Ahy_B05g079386 isoform A [Arachis hypogaea]
MGFCVFVQICIMSQKFFAENKNIAGFDNPGKSLYTTVRELVENSLDSAESISELLLFVANQKKPADIVGILVTNRSKLLRLLGDLKLDKADKAEVMKEIAALEPKDRP